MLCPQLSLLKIGQLPFDRLLQQDSGLPRLSTILVCFTFITVDRHRHPPATSKAMELSPKKDDITTDNLPVKAK